MTRPERGPYLNSDGDWWVAVEDASFREARAAVVMCLGYDVPEEGTLRYLGKTRASMCEAPAGDHDDPYGGLDPANCDSTCRRDTLAYHFQENRRW